MNSIALFVGRFQPWHIGHRDALDTILGAHNHVKIVIGSAQESRTEKNPWTAPEREEIIRSSIEDIYTPDMFSFFHLEDILESDEAWLKELQNLAGKFDKLYSGNTWMEDICKEFDVPFQWINEEIDINATDVRRLLSLGRSVKDFSTVVQLPK